MDCKNLVSFSLNNFISVMYKFSLFVKVTYQTALLNIIQFNAHHLHNNLHMVVFAAHCTIHSIKIGFQKCYILPGQFCP